MSLHTRRKLSTAAALLIGVGMLPFAGGMSASAAPAAPSVTVRHVQKAGSASYKPSPNGSGDPAALSTEIPRAFGPEAQEGADAAAAANARGANAAGSNRSMSLTHGAKAANRASAGAVASANLPNDVVRNGPRVLASFDGINHRDQRLTNGGNQFSLEPPDQGLCFGNGHVVEVVNDAFQVRGSDGSAQTGVVGLNPFFGYPPAIDRTTGIQGQFVTDPSCLFDPTTRTFFLAVLTLEVVPATGDFTGDNHLDLAVAKDPTGTWTIYHLDVTEVG